MILALLAACRPPGEGPPPDTGAVELVTTVEGYGAASTGGDVAGHAERVVTSLADDGPGSLREALAAGGPVVVTFAVDGDLVLAQPLLVPSETTIDATGRRVTIREAGLVLAAVHDVRIVNLAFADVRAPADAIALTDGARRVLVLHGRFDSSGLAPEETDEQISVTWGATDVTIAWCLFEGHDKVLLFGNGDAPPEVDGEIRVTLHDNVFLGTGRRHPYLRYGRVDAYGNLIADWRFYLAKTYGVRAADDGRIRLENNRFEQRADGPGLAIPPDLAVALEGSPWLGAVSEGSGVVEPIDNVVDDERIVLEAGGTSFDRPYPATLRPLSDAWREALVGRVGNTR